MNLGFEGATSVEVRPEDKKDSHHVKLYLKLLEEAPISEGMSVLEIGCGRGGGCYVLQKYFGIKNITAIDRSAANINLAKKLVPGVTFRKETAEKFQTTDLFDLVVNLESSHLYSSRAEFFKTVSAVLKPGGYFAFGDLVRKPVIEDVEKALKAAGFSILHGESLNTGVIHSIEKNSVIQYPTATNYPGLFPKKVHGFFVTIHSIAYQLLKSGDVQYRIYVLRKD